MPARVRVSPWVPATTMDIECCLVMVEGWSRYTTLRRQDIDRQPSDAARALLRANRIAAIVAHIETCLATGHYGSLSKAPDWP